MDTQSLSTKMPRIGDPAPDFEAITTTGMLKFSEYNKDNWVILFPIQQILRLFALRK